MTYTPKTFNLPALEGISEKQIKAHLALYEGYVKHVDLIMEAIARYGTTDDEIGKYSVVEMRRRLAFEFNGMRMHEYYFEQFEGGVHAPREGTALATAITEKYPRPAGEAKNAGLVEHVKSVAGTRGIGWVVVYHDQVADPPAGGLHTVFVGDHELGQLAGLPIILALDLWEHAYMVDYLPADKKSYIDAFFANLNWGVVEKRYVIAA